MADETSRGDTPYELVEQHVRGWGDWPADVVDNTRVEKKLLSLWRKFPYLRFGQQALVGTKILEEYLDDGWTPHPDATYLFEIIYPENRIVVDYRGQLGSGTAPRR